MLYRTLSCDRYHAINQSIQSWVDGLENLSGTTQFWNPQSAADLLKSCPDFLQWLSEHKIMIKSVAVTYGTSPDCCAPHVDTPPARFKLSWPVKNTKHTWNRWFKPAVENPSIVNNDLGGTIYLDLKELQEIDRRELLSPCLIDAGVIHDVWCDDLARYPRIGLQCQLVKEPPSL